MRGEDGDVSSFGILLKEIVARWDSMCCEDRTIL
jgi:hypothetical protein